MTTVIKVEKLDESYIRVFSEPSVEAELSDFFSFEVPGAKYTPKFKARLWDGILRLYDTRRNTLYTGLIPHLQRFSADNGYTLDLSEITPQNAVKSFSADFVDEFCNKLNPHSDGHPIVIRDYQQDAIRQAINAERTLLISPTASGKSLIIYALLRWHLLHNRKLLIIVPSTSLVEQMYSDFEDYSTHNGFSVADNAQRLYSGFPRQFTKNVLISTWQSIYKQPKEWFKQFDVMFGDEAHEFAAKSLVDVLCGMRTTKYRIGTTGTLNNKKVHRLVLEGLFGSVYQVTTTKALMDKGVIAKLKISCLMLQYTEEERKAAKQLDYQAEMHWLCANDKRNKFIANLAVKSTGNTLVLFQYVEKHGRIIEDMVRSRVDANRKVFFVYGDVGVTDREAVRAITEKETDAIIIASYGVFSRGTNIKAIDNVIFASPSKSKVRNLQSIGRGLRLKHGKVSCNLYDIADDLSWKSKRNTTLDHAAERYKLYSEEQFEMNFIEVQL